MVNFLFKILRLAYENNGNIMYSMQYEKVIAIIPDFFGDDVADLSIKDDNILIKLTDFGKEYVRNNFKEYCIE